MKCHKMHLLCMIFCAVYLSAGEAWANKLTVTNVCLNAGGPTYTYVQSDISWNNSWRATWTEGSVTNSNWDAAWVFVKYRYQGEDWKQVSLDTNDGYHTAIGPVPANINVGLSTKAGGTNFGCGVFLYRSADGSGNWTNTVKLRWNFQQDGVFSTSRVDISVHAIEMVYVPQGSFYVGDGTAANIACQFCSNTTGTAAFQITNENYTIALGGGTAGSLGNNNASGFGGTADDFNNATPKTLPAAFPKGYNAFYCMKYEISEGQWVSFFNMLTNNTQKATRDITANVPMGKGSDGVVNRNTVAWTTSYATTLAPDRACGFLNWADVAAYADWSGLRPMTELEFEKACRGPLAPVANEYVWGTTALTDITGFSGTDGSGTETASPVNANCNYGGAGLTGPTRCGIYATATSGREASGATYWGIMEMSGNLWERPVTVGNAGGRAFTGSSGDGRLDASGNADVVNWPAGTGFRGGNWADAIDQIRTSGRAFASFVHGDRYGSYGGRAVRPAPSGGQ